MEANDAVRALSALAHPNRLSLFRLLVRAGPDGMRPKGMLEELGGAPNTLSSQLSILTAAGLLEAQRDGREIRYIVRFGHVSDFLVFLAEWCAAGRR